MSRHYKLDFSKLALAGALLTILFTFVSGKDEEAPYKIIKKSGSYEERFYASQKWVCNTVTDQKYGANDNLKQFYKLRGYSNEPDVAISMTIPVRMKKLVVNGEKSFQMCLYIPSKYQSNTPKPTDETVHILQIPDQTLYVKRYSGFILTESQWKSKADEFEKILRKDGKNDAVVEYGFFYGCGFSPPYQLWSRRNEVWFEKK